MFNSLGQNINSPVIAFNSNKSGPHIILTCLNHGNEVIGLNTALEIMEIAKNSNQFVGKITMFTCLNFEGFGRNSRFFEGEFLNGNIVPNLNRKWPGDNSSYSSRIAKNIFEQIIQCKPDLVLDLHSYSHNSLIHIIVDRPGGEMETKLIKLCQCSNIPFYLEYEAKNFAAQNLDKSLSNQLCLHNIPSLTIELGPKMGFSLFQSKMATKTLINLLICSNNLLNLPKIKTKNTDLTKNLKYQKDDLFELQKTEIDKSAIYFRLPICNNSDFSGMWKPIVEIGKFIPKNQIIAQIINLYGQIIHQILMPENGFIIAFEDEAIVYPMRQIATFIKNKKNIKLTKN